MAPWRGLSSPMEESKAGRLLRDDTPGFEGVIVGEIFHVLRTQRRRSERPLGWPRLTEGQPGQALTVRQRTS